MRASGQAGGMGNTQGRDPVTAPQGPRDSSEIKKQTIIMTEEEEERRRKDRGEREGEKKLPLFHLSRKIMSFSIRQNPVSNPRFSSY